MADDKLKIEVNIPDEQIEELINQEIKRRNLEEVVHCADCVFYDPTTVVSPALDIFKCSLLDVYFSSSRYCGYGRRRADDKG